MITTHCDGLSGYADGPGAGRIGASGHGDPMVGMMLHRDGSSHAWVAGQIGDLIVTMDDATSEIYSAFFVAEEGTMSSFRGLTDVIAERGVFCALPSPNSASS